MTVRLGEGINWAEPPPPPRQLVGQVVWDMPDDTDAKARHAALEARLAAMEAAQTAAAAEHAARVRALEAELARANRPRRRIPIRDANGDITEVIEELIEED